MASITPLPINLTPTPYVPVDMAVSPVQPYDSGSVVSSPSSGTSTWQGVSNLVSSIGSMTASILRSTSSPTQTTNTTAGTAVSGTSSTSSSGLFTILLIGALAIAGIFLVKEMA